MKLTRRAKLAAGIATGLYIGLPLLLAGVVMLLAMAIPFFVVLSEQSGRGEPEGLYLIPVVMTGVVVPMVCLLAPLTIGLLVFYLAHMLKNPNTSDTTRLIFALGLIFMPLIVMPLYFLLHIWPEPEADRPTPVSAPAP